MVRFLQWFLRKYWISVIVTVDGEKINVVPGDTCEVNWHLRLERDGEYVRIYSQDEYVGILDSKCGWKTHHQVHVSCVNLLKK